MPACHQLRRAQCQAPPCCDQTSFQPSFAAMEAITAPLQLIRSLYAAQAVGQPADGDFGVKERFSALLADPQLAAQARAHSNVHRMRVV